jgi:probable DNA metabolism protein
LLEGAAGILFQVSIDAYDALVHVWMSEFPIEAQALRYALRVLGAAKRAALAAYQPALAAKYAAPAGALWYTAENARIAAAKTALDRGDGDCRAVLAVVHKVGHEINRLMGFLRFSPDAQGRYIARCAPDHCVLPALGPHFTRRFGEAPWVIIDERRGLALVREQAGEPGLFALDSQGQAPGDDPWEGLWRSYHRTVNIESRKNPRLQRQFVPLRYRQYLTEFESVPDGSTDPEL